MITTQTIRRTMQIKLNRKAINGKLLLAGKYVTNGRWAILRDHIINGAMLTTIEAARALYKLQACEVAPMPEKVVTDLIINELEAGKLREYKATGWIHKDAMCEQYEYRCDKGTVLYLDRIYVDGLPGLFGESVWSRGAANIAFSGPISKVADFQAMIMPMRVADKRIKG